MGFSTPLFARAVSQAPQFTPFAHYKLNSRWSLGPMFTFDDLAGRQENDRDLIRNAAPFDGRFLDHLNYWWLGTAPTCITSEAYDHESRIGRMPLIEAWANRNGLHVCQPGVLTSWWFPGQTRLLEFTKSRH